MGSAFWPQGGWHNYALTNAALPYLLSLGAQELPHALAEEPALARGVNLYRGKLVHPDIAAALGSEVEAHLAPGASL